MNRAFLARAEQDLPRLSRRTVRPVRCVELRQDEKAFQGVAVASCPAPETLSAGDSVIYDFGEHLVGQIRLTVLAPAEIPDSPLCLRVTPAEMPQELHRTAESYHGTLSSSWLQTEDLHLDVLPQTITLPRRYAFRYLRLEVRNSARVYRIAVTGVEAIAVTAAGKALSFQSNDVLLDRIDRTSVQTLRDCMQEVFEDGPKRDRRLWLGDLYLQAKANEVTFRRFSLVRRCLYLFAALPVKDGSLSCCIYTAGKPVPAPLVLPDYALLFVPALEDYVRATGDSKTLRELYPTAKRQLQLMKKREGADGLLADASGAFIDWAPLDRLTPLEGVRLFALSSLARLARKMKDEKTACRAEKTKKRLIALAKEKLFDPGKQLFTSSGQFSAASQVWMVLGGVAEGTEAADLLKRTMNDTSLVGMNTPYMMHYFLEACRMAGLQETVTETIRSYWGGMVQKGADTFWEAYSPEDDFLSPYGDSLINSYCHAWSCTPCCFLRGEYRR